MLKNYFKIAWRNLRKHKTYSLINIAGLAIGLCCFLLIALYVFSELSYDKYNDKADRIYRVNSDITIGSSDLVLATTSDMMGELLMKDYPEVENYTRIYNSNGPKLIKKGNEFINESKVAHVDSTFFKVFTLPAIEGNTDNALAEPNSVVITRSVAEKYFGTTNVIGKELEVKENEPVLFKINAVVEDVPKESHFDFEMFFSMQNVNYNWGALTNHNFFTYLVLKPSVKAEDFEKHFPEYIEEYVFPSARQFMELESMEEFKNSGNSIQYSLMPLTKIHLHSDRQFELMPPNNIQYIYIFLAVAIFILLIACINFMNLTTARSSNRAKEVGIRKVLGTSKNFLVGQFLVESMLLVFISLVIALGFTYLALPFFNDIAFKELSFSDIFSGPVLLVIILVVPVVGFLAGAYPAFFLSAFKPIMVLKGKLTKSSKTLGLRSSLVVFQFITSIVLIIGTIVVYQQLQFIRDTNLGFSKDQVLLVDNTYFLRDNAQTFKQEVQQLAGVSNGTLSGFLPISSSSRSDSSYSTEAVMNSSNSIQMQRWRVDENYIPTMGMEMHSGRNFSKDFPSDSSAIIINETAAKMLGGDPLSKTIYTHGGDGTEAHTVIGIVKDFNFESVKQKIGPVSLQLSENIGIASFKVNTSNISTLIPQIKNKWDDLAGGMPFNYRFLDEAFNTMYSGEQRVGQIALLFSVLAIFIACLGLFGLAAFIAEQRKKEIGIRKVLGASSQGVVTLLSKDFLKLVIIAFVIAVPLAWWGMHSWLQDFAYRINISWWIYAIAGLFAVFIAVATVSLQALKAAVANPIKSLRTE